MQEVFSCHVLIHLKCLLPEYISHHFDQSRQTAFTDLQIVTSFASEFLCKWIRYCIFEQILSCRSHPLWEEKKVNYFARVTVLVTACMNQLPFVKGRSIRKVNTNNLRLGSLFRWRATLLLEQETFFKSRPLCWLLQICKITFPSTLKYGYIFSVFVEWGRVVQLGLSDIPSTHEDCTDQCFRFYTGNSKPPLAKPP